jgi:hypothetical protein
MPRRIAKKEFLSLADLLEALEVGGGGELFGAFVVGHRCSAITYIVVTRSGTHNTQRGGKAEDEEQDREGGNEWRKKKHTDAHCTHTQKHTPQKLPK